MIVQKRKAPRSGILRAAIRVWKRHDKHVRSHECIAAKFGGCSGKVRACHRRSAANSGTGLKPHSWELYPGCDGHHKEQHDIGQPAFELKYGVSLVQAARECVLTSPDWPMKQHMREHGYA
jgi:hypothetical protein